MIQISARPCVQRRIRPQVEPCSIPSAIQGETLYSATTNLACGALGIGQ